MKASELIERLQSIIEIYGDREIYYYGENPAIDKPSFLRKISYVADSSKKSSDNFKMFDNIFLIR